MNTRSYSYLTRRHAAILIGLALGLAAPVLPAVAGGCNVPLEPPPGGTVTWTAAGGPYVICTDIVIPQTATVIVEAGTSIDILDGVEIDVMGTLLVHGTAADPVLITGEDFFIFDHPLDIFGQAEIDFATITCRVHVRNTASLLLADSTVTGALGSDTGRTYVQIDRCAFPDGDLDISHGTLAIRDTTVTNESVSVGGYMLADGLGDAYRRLTLVKHPPAEKRIDIHPFDAPHAGKFHLGQKMPRGIHAMHHDPQRLGHPSVHQHQRDRNPLPSAQHVGQIAVGRVVIVSCVAAQAEDVEQHVMQMSQQRLGRAGAES